MNHTETFQQYRTYTGAGRRAKTHSPLRERPASDTELIPVRLNSPTPSTKCSQVPFRSGFQAKGVYRDRTDELIAIRNSKQESKRLEEARLQKRLEKLIQLHFPYQPQPHHQSQELSHQNDQPERCSNSFANPPIINLSQMLFGIVKNVSSVTSGSNRGEFGGGLSLLGHNSAIRAQEQSIVRWQEDQEVKQCKFCQTAFGLRIRKHHCRLCGSVVCFSPPWTTGQRERCSTMIRFEWEPGSPGGRTEKTLGGKVVQLSEQEMGIVDDPQAVLELISPSGSKPPPPPNPAPRCPPSSSSSSFKPRKGIRVCTHCLAIILRRQAMTYPPKIPDYIYLYATLKRLQDEIDRAIPEFQELLSSSKHSTPSNLNPSTSAGLPVKLLTIRRKLLANLSLFDAHSKKMLAQAQTPGVENASEVRLVTAIATRAGLFLRDHMSLIRSLGLLEAQPTPQPAKKTALRPRPLSSSQVGSPSSSTQQFEGAAARPQLHIKNLSLSSDHHHSSSFINQDTHNSLLKLNVLLEQENRIEAFLAVAQSKRQLEDVASLQASLDDLREEISNLKKAIL
ncbi:hypothetical protein PCANC_13164 [Puccinia coronata f. sp. avenae]|uniref:FYVE-type domain-containing protein n=1 Tax=Puccinia coronata f. sp. avenae TaxID=200324 RepID=A0A2N5UVL5_9BASI|nr:hypothetical protein PCASD_21880 [Puccinia coronata f. sp. avenae]PLW41697.1 hypothetical protein PCANC_13164 [Puccinia coronata f. sp. avenae]